MLDASMLISPVMLRFAKVSCRLSDSPILGSHFKRHWISDSRIHLLLTLCAHQSWTSLIPRHSIHSINFWTSASIFMYGKLHIVCHWHMAIMHEPLVSHVHRSLGKMTEQKSRILWQPTMIRLIHWKKRVTKTLEIRFSKMCFPVRCSVRPWKASNMALYCDWSARFEYTRAMVTAARQG